MEINMSSIFEPYLESTPEHERSPENWHKFLHDHGLKHKSLSRIVVIDKEKWFLTKIKHGIE